MLPSQQPQPTAAIHTHVKQSQLGQSKNTLGMSDSTSYSDVMVHFVPLMQLLQPTADPYPVNVCRLVTSAFLHDSFSHLALNTYALYTVAPEVEAVLGHWTFLSVYLLAGLAGSSAAFVFGDTITVGASTCVFGLIGDFFVNCLSLFCHAHSCRCYR